VSDDDVIITALSSHHSVMKIVTVTNRASLSVGYWGILIWLISNFM